MRVRVWVWVRVVRLCVRMGASVDVDGRVHLRAASLVSVAGARVTSPGTAYQCCQSRPQRGQLAGVSGQPERDRTQVHADQRLHGHAHRRPDQTAHLEAKTWWKFCVLRWLVAGMWMWWPDGVDGWHT